MNPCQRKHSKIPKIRTTLIIIPSRNGKNVFSAKKKKNTSCLVSFARTGIYAYINMSFNYEEEVKALPPLNQPLPGLPGATQVSIKDENHLTQVTTL